MQLPSKSQWRQFLKTLSKKEKIIFSLFLFLFIFSFSFLAVNFYFKNTEIRPATGGTFIEGVIGQPRFINPIYAPLYDVDRDLTQLLFAGLMKYNNEGKIIPDLIKDYQILEEGKTWQIELKENLFWSDNQPLTVDDVIFTIETIQNPEINSPLRPSWLGVRAEKISDSKISLEFSDPSSVFLENLTLKIIPQHIWKNISAQNFPLSAFNLKPIGSGPYQLKNLVQDKEGGIISLDLIRNPNYHREKPNLLEISFQFFNSEEGLVRAAQKEEINGFSLVSSADLTKQNLINEKFNLYSFRLPRYFAVFFNPEEAKVLAEKRVRMALNYGTNKEEIVSHLSKTEARDEGKTFSDQVLMEERTIIDSPALPEIYGLQPPTIRYEFNPEKARLLLEEAGFLETETGVREKVIIKELAFQFTSNLSLGSQGKEVEELQKCLAKNSQVYPQGQVTGYFGNLTKEAVIRFQEKYQEDVLAPFGLIEGTGEVRKETRNKLNEVCFETPKEVIPLKFSLATVNQPRLVAIANLLKEQWQALGAEIEIKTYDISTLEREIIKPRNYQALLFGQVLGMIPDPLPFWHSSQKKDPGLNLALYENEEVDAILEDIRKKLDEKERKELLEKFQEILIAEAPAVFLYNPDYFYFVSKEIKGVETKIISESSQRFSDIENWYIRTKRSWK